MNEENENCKEQVDIMSLKELWKEIDCRNTILQDNVYQLENVVVDYAKKIYKMERNYRALEKENEKLRFELHKLREKKENKNEEN